MLVEGGERLVSRKRGYKDKGRELKKETREMPVLEGEKREKNGGSQQSCRATTD